jgi:hypothetical protein
LFYYFFLLFILRKWKIESRCWWNQSNSFY